MRDSGAPCKTLQGLGRKSALVPDLARMRHTHTRSCQKVTHPCKALQGQARSGLFRLRITKQVIVITSSMNDKKEMCKCVRVRTN